jgi:hypothetical protein
MLDVTKEGSFTLNAGAGGLPGLRGLSKLASCLELRRPAGLRFPHALVQLFTTETRKKDEGCTEMMSDSGFATAFS